MNLRDYGIKYLIDSHFVEALTKKSMFPSDITDLFEDYLQEVWLSILELPEDKWEILYKDAINRNKDFEYTIRNFISVLIRNTVKSSSSPAYKLLKKNSVFEQQITQEDWKIIEYNTPDTEVDFGEKVPKKKRNSKDED